MKLKEIIFGACLVTSVACQAQDGLFHLQFATLQEAQQMITTEDHHLKAMGQFDLDARVGKAGATKAELMQLLTSECREWTQAEQDTLTKTFRILEQRIKDGGYKIPVPPTIVLIKTTMKEEGDAGAYTRDNQIYIGHTALQARKMRDGRERPAPTAESMCSLMAHELFHVLTRKDLEFKRRMYETIGFVRMDKELEFAQDIKDLRISNPDVSCYDSYAELTVNGEKGNYTMMISADKPYEGGSFFQYMRIGLIPLDKDFKPVIKDGKTVLYPLDQSSDFYDKVGKNTGYVINPEECLADNFAIAINGFKPNPRMQELPNPEIIDRMHAVMK